MSTRVIIITKKLLLCIRISSREVVTVEEKYGHQSKHFLDKQKGESPQRKSCWFCDQKGHSMSTCNTFKAAENKHEEANFACDLEESDNESLDELAF